MDAILNRIKKELKNSIDEKTQSTSQHFFKEKIKAYGVKVPTVNKISKTYFDEIKSKSKVEIV